MIRRVIAAWQGKNNADLGLDPDLPGSCHLHGMRGRGRPTAPEQGENTALFALAVRTRNFPLLKSDLGPIFHSELSAHSSYMRYPPSGMRSLPVTDVWCERSLHMTTDGSASAAYVTPFASQVT